jgi:hypothetical protein
LTPARLMDTRPGQSTVDGQAAGTGAIGSGGIRHLTVAGRGGVPGNASAVVLNVTATQPSTGGYFTVWPRGADQPLASNLNFTAGQTIPNLVVAKVGANGQVSFYNSQGSTHAIVDVLGYFAAGSDYGGLTPARLMDTRPGQLTVDGQAAGTGAIGSGGIRHLTVAGRGGVPGNASAVVLNVTATQPSVGGYLTVWPRGADQPLASNLNFTAGQTIANLVVAKVGANGQVSFYNNSGSTHAIVDVLGYLP